MRIVSRLAFLLSAIFLSAYCLAARQIDSGPHPGDRIYLDVVVTPVSGPAITDLQRQDFTIFDNDVPQNIASFESVGVTRSRVVVFIVIDAVKVSPRAMAAELDEIRRFLRADGGRLAFPTTVNLVTASGLEYEKGPSRDGKVLAASLNKRPDPFGSIPESPHDISFQAFTELVALERNKPDRKLVIWVSPGWPLSIASDYENRANKKQVEQLRLEMFGNLVQLSKQLREGQITVYSIDPDTPSLADLDSRFTNGSTHLRQPDRESDPAGVASPREVRADELALEKIALQSGGLALHQGNDLASAIRTCLADASTSYELSFDPVLTDEPNLYHHLKVEIARSDLTARTRRAYYSQPWPGAKFAAQAERLGDTNPDASQVPTLDERDASESTLKDLRPRIPTYVDMPLEELSKQIPDLKDIQPAKNQEQLPLILKNIGHNVDEFIHNVGELIASEDVTQEKLSANGKIKGKEHVQDDYLILHHGYEWGANAEYRMDKKGNRLEAIGLDKGYLVTAGYALSCITFATGTQAQSNFLYLGNQKVETRDAFVVAFAQRPGDATFTTVMRGTGNHEVSMLTQGILWIDQSSFQILRMRTDLLTPNAELRLDQSTTDVSFGEVKLQDNSDPLWLPKDVSVFMKIANERYRNLHHYTNYRRYQVAVKIGN